MIIMGIDPGTATTGWGIVEVEKKNALLKAAGIIQTPAHTPLPERLATIYVDICELIKTYTPQVVAVEELFFNTNVKTALSVGQARGIILLSAQQSQCIVASYTPLQVKMAITGYGRADKKQMQKMVATILKLPEIIKPDDASDAVGIALTHAQQRFEN